METQRSNLLYWPYYQAKNIEELKHSLICATLELETTRLAAQEEIRKREQQLTQLQELLNKVITERDEAKQNYKTLLFQKQQHPKIAPQVHSRSCSSIDNNGSNFSSLDTDDSIISSLSTPFSSLQTAAVPVQTLQTTAITVQKLQTAAVPDQALQLLSNKKARPEKGRLLQAVINAGPLLQTLLLAGPLPQWRHPPPPLESFDIPPVTISGASNIRSEVLNTEAHTDPYWRTDNFNKEEFIFDVSNNVCGVVNRKRGFSYGVCDGSTESNKYQRVLFH